MGYLTKLSSLKERASARVAINLCQDINFKEVALGLEKPTYGAIINMFSRDYFITDPELLSACNKMKRDRQNIPMTKHITELFHLAIEKKVEKWYAAIDEHCQRLTDRLPLSLKQGIHAWINRIALEYLSYSRRQEMLSGVTCYFLMDFLTLEDWLEAGQLDHTKLAKRLLETEQLTILQRYRIACIYCLPENIFHLWKRLPEKKKLPVNKNFAREEDSLVIFWLNYMTAHENEKVACIWCKRPLLAVPIGSAVQYGNRTAVKLTWKIMEEDARQQTLIQLALISVQSWQNIVSDDWIRNLISNTLPDLNSESIEHFNLPYYYSDLFHFFLSEMHEEQQLTFFKRAFQIRNCNSVLECYLDWPLRDDFLPTMNRLWGITPKDKYGQCLLTLVKKYCFMSHYKHGKREYNYASLLLKLWEETPDEYKQYVFSARNLGRGCNIHVMYGSVVWWRLSREESSIDYSKTVLEIVMLQLLKVSPFQGKDEAVFKRILHDLPKEERIEFMHSETGGDICSILIQEGKWSFVNWLLEECLPNEEVSIFKKQFVQSDWSRKFCLDKLVENHEKYLEDLIDWSFESDAEKMQFKSELIAEDDSLDVCESFLKMGKFTEVERMMDFSLLSDQMKRFCKECFAEYTIYDCLSNCEWKKMDEILSWAFDTDEQIKIFKKTLFSSKGIDIHYYLIFFHNHKECVERFYEWFCLSPEEMKKVKDETILKPEILEVLDENSYVLSTFSPEGYDDFVATVHSCLTDEGMMMSLKKIVRRYFKEHFGIKKQRRFRYSLV